MKGFVPTPPALVDRMVEKLFAAAPPAADSTLLDPGCGAGPFISGVVRWCRANRTPIPRITGVDSDPVRIAEARLALAGVAEVTLIQGDFLEMPTGRYDYIIGNPPYVAITGLDPAERARYRARFLSATGRFDLYLLFFEQALRLLGPGGRLVFVTPEKYLYVRSAGTARRLLADSGLEEVELVDEGTFPGLVTYPVITTVARGREERTTRIVRRNGEVGEVALHPNAASWLPEVNGVGRGDATCTLLDAFDRISCGVATGADDVFVRERDTIPEALLSYAVPTIAGRELVAGEAPAPSSLMLLPYDDRGELLAEDGLGPLRGHLEEHQERLEGRVCAVRKPWYAFHETPPLVDLRRPKILCKDITARPWFVVDASGEIIPRHSVYYLVPRDAERIHELCEYLNSAPVAEYLAANCQRAANGFLRLQSHVLKRVPLPEELVGAGQMVGV